MSATRRARRAHLQEGREPQRPTVRPGNAWLSLAKPVPVEPRDKLSAILKIAEECTAPYGEWFRREVRQWAVSTGRSLDTALGLKRSGQPSAHAVAHQARRNAAIRFAAQALPAGSLTAKASQLSAIVHGEQAAPSAQVADLVSKLFADFGPGVCRSPRAIFDVLANDENDTE